MIKSLIRKYIWIVSGVVLGMIIGFIYWKYVGCVTGTCPITSSPSLSVLWGGLMGGLLLNIIKPLESNNNK